MAAAGGGKGYIYPREGSAPSCLTSVARGPAGAPGLSRPRRAGLAAAISERGASHQGGGDPGTGPAAPMHARRCGAGPCRPGQGHTAG